LSIAEFIKLAFPCTTPVVAVPKGADGRLPPPLKFITLKLPLIAKDPMMSELEEE